MPGYSCASAICDWVGQHVRSQSNTSSSATLAIDTLIDRVGICRDFAHLMIALCRAANLPARIASGIDCGVDPALGPQDFHAYVEVLLGNRWYVFDPSGTAIPMGFVRFATGRDAADIAFATIFGSISALPSLSSLFRRCPTHMASWWCRSMWAIRCQPTGPEPALTLFVLRKCSVATPFPESLQLADHTLAESQHAYNKNHADDYGDPGADLVCQQVLQRDDNA